MPDAETVFRTVNSVLGERVHRLPDGELGRPWIACQIPVFEKHPGFESVEPDPNDPRRAPKFRVRKGVSPRELQFDNLGYADWALASYELLTRLQSEGHVRRDVSFQVCIPSPMAVLQAYVPMYDTAAVEPSYEGALLHEIDRIAAAIPNDHLSIQFDCTDVLMWEGVRPTYYVEPAREIIEHMVRWGDHVPAGVELGYHLCYGDFGHRHAVEPADMAKMVDLANGVAGGIRRSIGWLHMPVPRNRTDDAYFAPLRDLRLPPETRLYLGLIHNTDGIEGARKRLAAASKVVPDFGVATECGLGRRPPETMLDLLHLHAAVADL
jgi:hypothetical protein